MRIQSFFLFILFLCVGFTADAQREETVLGNRGLRLSGGWGGSQNMISGMGSDNAYLSGGYGGLEFGKTLFVGFGNYYLANDVQWDNISNTNFDMKYGGLMLGYAHKSYNPIHPVVNLMVGKGKVEFKDGISDRFVAIQPSAGIEINVLRWFHIGLDGGYRFVTDVNSATKLTDKDLSGGFGQISFKFGYSWGSQTGWKKGSNKPKINVEVN